MSRWAIGSSKNKPPHRLSSLVCFPCSHWDTEHQLWGACPQPAVPAAPSQSLQALLRLPGQVLWIPLWRQCVRGLQGRTYCMHLLRLKGIHCGPLCAAIECVVETNRMLKPSHSQLHLVPSLPWRFKESLVALCHWWSVIMVAALILRLSFWLRRFLQLPKGAQDTGEPTSDAPPPSVTETICHVSFGWTVPLRYDSASPCQCSTFRHSCQHLPCQHMSVFFTYSSGCWATAHTPCMCVDKAHINTIQEARRCLLFFSRKQMKLKKNQAWHCSTGLLYLYSSQTACVLPFCLLSPMQPDCSESALLLASVIEVVVCQESFGVFWPRGRWWSAHSLGFGSNRVLRGLPCRLCGNISLIVKMCRNLWPRCSGLC